MHKSILCVFLLTSSLVLGADPASTSPAPAAAPSPSPAAPSATATDDLSQYKTADALWAHIKDQIKNLSTGLRSQDPAVKNLIPQIWASADALIKQYPKDPHAWDAKMMAIQTGRLAIQMHLASAPTPEQLLQELQDIAADNAAPPLPRAQADTLLIGEALQMAMQSKDDATSAANWDAVDAKIADFQKQFGNEFAFAPGHPAIIMLRGEELGMLKQSGNTARYQALLQKLATDPQPEVAAMANQAIAAQKKLADLKSKPVDLKYTALDGTAVDLSKMRGKVVLIDFWATWCGPCVGEVPNVVAAYTKYHSQGFEIMGVSLDQDKDKVLSFTKAHGMVWPQYFDGLGWKNAVSTSFGIDSIPAMWLVGKDGMLITTNARADLAGQVEKALAATP